MKKKKQDCVRKDMKISMHEIYSLTGGIIEKKCTAQRDIKYSNIKRDFSLSYTA